MLTTTIIDTEYDQSYLYDLWWLMHHSADTNRISVALTSYYDDSGTDGNSPVTVIAGPAMMKESFVLFDQRWREVLRKYRVPSPLHMKDFNQLGLRYEMKIAFLSEIAEVINRHKFFSLSVCVPQSDFEAALPVDAAKRVMSPYAFAFFCAVIINQKVSDNLDVADNMAYLVDSGSVSAVQMIEAHTELKRHGHGRTGAMAFDTDDNVSALQAADVFAWCARKRHIDGNLTGELSPLERIFSDQPDLALGSYAIHANVYMNAPSIELFAKPVHDWVYLNGKLPDIKEMMSW
jgi:hypothetical protein